MTTTQEQYEVTLTILNQIQWGVKAALGYSEPRVLGGSYGVVFSVRVLPFLKDGSRGSRPRKMQVHIELNAMDAYDIQVSYVGRNYETVVHAEAQDVFADQLNSCLLALDYDGQEPFNPRYWSAS